MLTYLHNSIGDMRICVEALPEKNHCIDKI